ncbi:hypothetical protein [Aestuariimicrobium ganziense]|uniref:hypothetical protein n=1 Tax=Aestuariimicrobium ganziense TaxID=2773677 RepID=UPI001942E23F|nr:hypothetical protein [Aestuariimicrobium ganziense]
MAGDLRAGRGTNPELAALLEDLHGTCWWCGKVADSLEHRHKRTDLERLWEGSRAPVWGGDGGRVETLRGPNSKSRSVRFGAVLCQNCNNARSQPFDRAYEVFSAALVDGMDGWWEADGVDLGAIYGPEWRTEALKLARYHVKNMGCQMADHGVRPPQSMVAFLDGEPSMPDVGLYLVKSESHYGGHKLFRQFGPNSGLFRPDDHVYFSPTRGRITGYEAMAIIGYVGVALAWSEAPDDHDSFFMHEFPVLNQIPADPGFAEELASLVLQALGNDPPQDADRERNL